VWTGDVRQNNNGNHSSNSLFYGENLRILAGLLRDSRIAGHVRLVYIDPPFSTQTRFHTRTLKHAYTDTLVGTEFLEFLRKRLVLLRELLADDGSIYVHIDEKMLFHVKLILDEVFGARNYRNCITRKKCNPKNYTRNQYGNISDYILFYTKSSQYVWNKPVEPWTEERAKEYQYREKDTGRRFMKVPIHAPGVRHGETGKVWRGKLPPPGKHWQYTPATLDEMDARGEIFWSANGNPRRKVYLDQSSGVSVQDIWMDFKDAHNQNVKITGYPTEKNPELLKRIIEASSNPGDIVLDCFSGSGTTLAVANHLQRSWIGIDTSSTAIQTTLQRFVKGTEPMGDFVSTNNGNGKRGTSSKHDEDVLPLFKDYTVHNTAPQEKARSQHCPITDFILYAEKERQAEIQGIAEEWLSQW
jgi:adenine-specific DNA-methyltransferase